MDGPMTDEYGSDISDEDADRYAVNVLAAIIAGKYYAIRTRAASESIERYINLYAYAKTPKIYENDFGPALSKLPSTEKLRIEFLSFHSEAAKVLKEKGLPFPDTKWAYRKAHKKWGVPWDDLRKIGRMLNMFR